MPAPVAKEDFDYVYFPTLTDYLINNCFINHTDCSIINYIEKYLKNKAQMILLDLIAEGWNFKVLFHFWTDHGFQNFKIIDGGFKNKLQIFFYND